MNIQTKTLVAATLSLLAAFGPAMAQDTTKTETPAPVAAPAPVAVAPKLAPPSSLKTHNWGFAAGFISGYGLAYRHWNPSGTGYQLTFVPVGRVNPDETFFNTSVGAMGLRALHVTKHTNFFGYYGGHYNFKLSDNEYDYYDGSGNTTPYRDKEITHNLFVGGGLGMEVHFWNINYSLMFGYAGNGREDKRTNGYPGTIEAHNGKWVGSLEFQPSLETALFYCF